MQALLDELVIELAASEVARSVALGVVRRDGGRLVETKAVLGAAPDDYFDLASVTKPFVALTAALLHTSGDYDLDAPLRHYLPEIAKFVGGDATSREHLSHRAGLRAHEKLFDSAEFGLPLARKDALRRAAAASRQTPKSDAVYSDLGYILVGEALTRSRKTALDDLVRDTLRLPEARRNLGSVRQLRAENAHPTFVATEALEWRGGLVRGEVHDDNAWYLGGSNLTGHAGMFGTLDGVLTFATYLLEHSTSSPSTHPLAAMLRPQPGGSFRTGFDGVSPRSSAGTLVGANAFGHLGFTGTSLWVDPTRNAAVVLLTNRVLFGRDPTRIKAARPRVHDAIWTHLDKNRTNL